MRARNIDGFRVKHSCQFCGQRRCDAFWIMHDGDLSICRSCAFEKLPALMADAFANHQREYPDRIATGAVGALALAEGAFWRALALAQSSIIAESRNEEAR